MSKILLTGGGGFIGSHLAEALVGAGHEVVILDSLISGKRSNLAPVADAVRLVEGDILDIDDLAESLGSPDIIIHLAALISGHDSLNEPSLYQRVNVEGTQRLIDYAGRAGVKRIVFASSSTVYGDRGGAAISESMLPRPLSVYALTKLSGEHLLRLYAPLRGFSHCSLRLFNVYGPRQGTDHPYANVTCKFSHAAANGLPVDLYGDGEQSRDFVYVSDVVAAFMAVLQASDDHLYNVGTEQAASINALLDALGEIGGAPLVTVQREPWPNDIRSIRADVGRFAAEFGFRPSTALRDGLRRTVEFFRNGR